jgi:hypothetical protein
MVSKILGTLDFADWDEPTPTDDWRLMLTEWLEYQRHQHSGQAHLLRYAALGEVVR